MAGSRTCRKPSPGWTGPGVRSDFPELCLMASVDRFYGNGLPYNPGMASRQPFKLSNTILYCERWRETLDFYRRVLALPVSVEKDWFVEFQLTEYSFVSIADAGRATIDAAGGRGVTLALQVEDIDAVHARLSDAGVDVPAVGRHPWGALSFFCRDPEGYRLEFWQPLESSNS